MKQKDFETLIMIDMQITRELTKNLIKELTAYIFFNLKIGNLIEIPNLGTLMLNVRPKRIYVDWRTGLTMQALQRNIVKMRIYQYNRRFYDFTYSPNKFDWRLGFSRPWFYQGPKTFPDSRAASQISINAKIDLLTANNFINAFVLQILTVTKSNDKVIINNLGTFSKIHILARNGRNPSNGETIGIPAYDRLHFRVATKLNEWIR